MNVPFKKKTIMTLIFGVVAVALILVLLGSLSSKSVPIDDKKVHSTPVKIINAEKGSLTKTLRMNGYIQSDNIITVIPFVSGTLEKITVELGDSVKKDQPLAKIDSRFYDLQLKQAEAAYLGSKSAYERLEQLFNSNAATRQNYEQSKSQYDAYKSQYELAQLQVSYTNILAPIDGTVLLIHSNQGSMAAPEIPILTIGDLSNLIVKLNIPDKYYELFRSSQEMKVKIIRPRYESEPIDAHISSVSPIINAESKNFEISCRIDGDISSLRPGMFVYCIFEVDRREDVYYLPLEILGHGNSLWYVNSSTSTGEKIEITDSFMNTEYFTIPEKMADYDFIMEGQSFLQPGQKVQIR
ncbi:MAG: efflux RND transporter periplasmic adaptor subunit [Spirochaetales bacterium]|nr:efflux RND transporter periplasmic adaptor subunit [Spirochaetales bacterium]